MSARIYFRVALFAPLALPLLVLLFIRFLPSLGQSSLAGVLAYQLGYGGPGYLVFLPVVFFLTQGKSERQLMRLAWLLPLAFAPFCAASFWFMSFVLGISVEPITLSAFFGILPFATLYSVVFGYVYVVVAFLIYLLLLAIAGTGGSAAQQGAAADRAASRHVG